jgi:hypothetical protein
MVARPTEGRMATMGRAAPRKDRKDRTSRKTLPLSPEGDRLAAFRDPAVRAGLQRHLD